VIENFRIVNLTNTTIGAWFKMKTYSLTFIVIVATEEIADGLLLHT
jgi:hypothetical protein